MYFIVCPFYSFWSSLIILSILILLSIAILNYFTERLYRWMLLIEFSESQSSLTTYGRDLRCFTRVPSVVRRGVHSFLLSYFLLSYSLNAREISKKALLRVGEYLSVT